MRKPINPEFTSAGELSPENKVRFSLLPKFKVYVGCAHKKLRKYAKRVGKRQARVYAFFKSNGKHVANACDMVNLAKEEFVRRIPKGKVKVINQQTTQQLVGQKRHPR